MGAAVVAEPADVADAVDLALVAERIRHRENAVRAGAVAYLHNGLDLIEAKRRLGHGAFSPWCEREFCGTLGWSQKSIERMMAAAELVGGKIDILSNLGIGRTTVYRISEKGTPNPIKQAFLAGIDAGDASAGRTALAAIRDAKADPKRSEREQALTSLAALLRRRLGRDNDQFAVLAKRAGIDLGSLPVLLRQERQKTAPRPPRQIAFDRRQVEMFAPTEAEVAPAAEAEADPESVSVH